MTHGAFDAIGYGVLPSFLGARDLRVLADGLAAALRAPPHPGMSRRGNDLVPLRWDDPIVAHVLRSRPHLAALADLIGARDPRWIAAYVSTKAPHSPALWWHQDWWCWDHPISYRRAAAQVAVLCYLGDTQAQNGALRVLPGSHHASAPIHRELPEPHGAAAESLRQDHAAMTDVPGQTTLAMRAGDAVVLDYRLLHGTHANQTASRRDCILLSFVPDWAGLPDEIKAHLIVHPALPREDEAARRAASGYDSLLPRFDGAPQSLPVNRIAPAAFAVHDA
jgi:ectoine hydroxylase-related dioxygenase (phytanoyl-CoA dioxygenase family)